MIVLSSIAIIVLLLLMIGVTTQRYTNVLFALSLLFGISCVFFGVTIEKRNLSEYDIQTNMATLANHNLIEKNVDIYSITVAEYNELPEVCQEYVDIVTGMMAKDAEEIIEASRDLILTSP